MLIGCCMKHKFRFVSSENLFHMRFVCNGAYNGPHLQVTMITSHKQTHIMHRCFSLVYKHKFCRLECCYLSCHFRSDTSCRTSDKNSSTCKHILDGIHIHLYLVTRKQVLNVHLMQLSMRQW